MKTLTTVVMALSMVVVLGLSARAGAPAPVRVAAPAGGGLFVESADSKSSKLTVSGEQRTRWETRQNMTDTSSANPDRQEWVESRARLGLLFEAQDVEVFLQAQSYHLWGGRTGLNGGVADSGDTDSLDVQQAYVKLHPEIFGLESTLTIGRQELALGSRMLLGNGNKGAGLSHDALRLDMTPIANLSSSLFVAKVVENSVIIPENTNAITAVPGGAGSMNDTHLFGLWNTYSFSEEMLLDVYVLYVQEDDEGDATHAENLGYYAYQGVDAKVWTGGVRFKVKEFTDPWLNQKLDFSAELALQVGTINPTQTKDIDIQDSFAFETEIGWKPIEQWSPRLAFGMAWASGDDDPNDENFNTFQPLFGDVDCRLGEADLFGLSNIRVWYFALTCKPMDIEKLDVGVACYRIEAFEEQDLHGAAGDGVGNGTVNAAGTQANNVGDEIDLFAAYKLNDNADLKFTWAHVEPQYYITKQAGMGNSPANRVFLTLNVKF